MKDKITKTGHVCLSRQITPHAALEIHESRSLLCKIHTSHVNFGDNNASRITPLPPSLDLLWRYIQNCACLKKKIPGYTTYQDEEKNGKI